MSNFKVKTQVRPETKILKAGNVTRGMGGIPQKSEGTGLVGLFSSSELPSASGVPAGSLAFNTTTAKLQITVSGSWVDC